MPTVFNPDDPPKDAARQRADRRADQLRSLHPDYPVRVVESIKSRFEVVVSVPFRYESLTWAERAAETGTEGA